MTKFNEIIKSISLNYNSKELKHEIPTNNDIPYVPMPQPLKDFGFKGIIKSFLDKDNEKVFYGFCRKIINGNNIDILKGNSKLKDNYFIFINERYTEVHFKGITETNILKNLNEALKKIGLKISKVKKTNKLKKDD
jgi:hypothetical protein